MILGISEKLIFSNKVLKIPNATMLLTFTFPSFIAISEIAALITFMLSTLALSALGIDYLTALSGSISCVANVGPGLGDIIGPDKTYADLPDTAKWILSCAMLAGRLEFTSIVALFLPFLWRKNT